GHDDGGRRQPLCRVQGTALRCPAVVGPDGRGRSARPQDQAGVLPVLRLTGPGGRRSEMLGRDPAILLGFGFCVGVRYPMAVKLRLTRVGKKKKPQYRIVAADSRSPRDGRFIEILGQYNPRMEPSV